MPRAKYQSASIIGTRNSGTCSAVAKTSVSRVGAGHKWHQVSVDTCATLLPSPAQCRLQEIQLLPHRETAEYLHRGGGDAPDPPATLPVRPAMTGQQYSISKEYALQEARGEPPRPYTARRDHEPGRDAFHRVPDSWQIQGRSGMRPYHSQEFMERRQRRQLAPQVPQRQKLKVTSWDRPQSASRVPPERHQPTTRRARNEPFGGARRAVRDKAASSSVRTMRSIVGLGRVASPRRPRRPKHSRFGETALPALAKPVSLMHPWSEIALYGKGLPGPRKHTTGIPC